jgi:CBS domain-containing protein
MRVSEAMTRDVRVADPNNSIRDVAKIMSDIDAGFMPVGENDHLVGTITDRDIAVRAVANGKGPETMVREVMTEEVRYCYEDEDLEEVCRNMAFIQVRRLPVVNRDKRLVGVVSLGDVAQSEKNAAAEAIEGVSRPGGAHNQSQSESQSQGQPQSQAQSQSQGQPQSEAQGQPQSQSPGQQQSPP